MKTGKILIIGGIDSSGGAGLTRDTAAANSLGFETLPVATAVTAQTDDGMIACELMSEALVTQQLEAALATGPIEAAKIGMLGNRPLAKTVVSIMANIDIPVVVDPVLNASSGGCLMTGDLPQELLSRADVLTPNLHEAATLTGQKIAESVSDVSLQAEALLAQGAKAVLIKGGHGLGNQSVDYLFDTSGSSSFSTPRLKAERRGTGCSLATMIACQLACGHDLRHACQLAKTELQNWLTETSSQA